MLRRKNGPSSEIEQDAEEAEKLANACSANAAMGVGVDAACAASRVPVDDSDILGPFVIAGVLAYIFSMVVDRLQERLRWPRALTVSLLYLVVLSVIGLLLFFGAETLFQQTRDFVSGGSNITEQGLRQIMGDQSTHSRG